MKKTMLILVALFTIGLQAVFAQTKTVTGTVTSADDGETLPGVSVLVKGTTIGTVTDFDGNFTLKVPTNAVTLTLSFVGMKTVDFKVSDETMNIVLESDAIGVDEVVVTAMGIAKEKKALGYAATSIGGDVLAESKAVNPMNAIQGKVAGIDISTAPGPGATQNVMIRGASSFGSNQPLYVVDGVPIINEQNRAGNGLNSNADFGSGLNAVNPDDIADMTILKGAAATALYGSRAANGVILITTKTGKNTDGKIQISYDGSISLSRVGRIAERQSMFGQGWSGLNATDENGNWGPAYSGALRPWGNVVDGTQQVKVYEFQEDRIRDFYDLGLNHKNSISASGGNEQTTYFISLSHNDMDGVVPTDVDSYKRTTISTRGSHSWGKLKFSTSINYANEKTSVVPSGQGTTLFRSIWEPAEDISLVDLEDYNSKFNNLDNYFTPYGVNPYFALNENGAVQTKNKFFGKAQMDYDILDNLKLTYRFGGDIETSTYETWTAQIAFTPGSINDEADGPSTPGSYEITKMNRSEVNHDVLLNYSKALSDDINISALFGFNANDRQYDRLTGTNSALDVPGFYNLKNGVASPTSSAYQQQQRLIGAFGNIDLDYRNFLYLTMTARNDWSSTLPEDNRSYFYPGITTSWLFTEMFNQQDVNVGPISFGKLRLAYGWTGNDADPYDIGKYYAQGGSSNPGYPNVDALTFPLNGVNSWMVSNKLSNPELKPEITKEFEMGLEMNFFSNRVGFDFSYYNKLTNDLISSVPLDPSTGYTSQVINIGDVRNKGFELMVHGTPVKTKNFEWNIRGNYSQNRNNVERLAEGEISLGGFGNTSIVAVEGEELGLFKTSVAKTVTIDGEEKVVVDGNGMVQSSADQVVMKDRSINEKFRAGLTNRLRFKDFSLSATMDYRNGGYMYSYTKDYQHWTGSGVETTFNDRNPFLVPNSVVENGNGTYSENTTPVSTGSLHTFYSEGGFQREDYFLIDKSYLKLREVSLSYTLPREMFERWKLSNVRLSFVASNFLLWTPADNQVIDPETTTFGNDIAAKFGEYGANPTNQTYTFGLSVSF